MNTYQVTRPFNGFAIGATLQDSDFANPLRPSQLIDQRKLAPLAAQDSQPTVAALRNASVRQLDALVAKVQDACVLEAAMATDTREAARKAYAKRLEELTDD